MTITCRRHHERVVDRRCRRIGPAADWRWETPAAARRLPTTGLAVGGGASANVGRTMLGGGVLPRPSRTPRRDLSRNRTDRPNALSQQVVAQGFVEADVLSQGGLIQ